MLEYIDLVSASRKEARNGNSKSFNESNLDEWR